MPPRIIAMPQATLTAPDAALLNDQPAHACTHCGLPVPYSRQNRPAANSAAQPEFCCYGCRLAFDLATPGPDAPTERAALSLAGSGRTGQGTLLLRLGLGVFLAMNIMVFSLFFYSQHVYQSGENLASSDNAQSAIASLFAYLLMLLTSAVVVLLGVPLARDVTAGWFDAQSRRFTIDANLLILIGVVAAFSLSVYNTLAPGTHGHVLYYDTAAMILVLVTLGGYLDSRAKLNATHAIESFFTSLPAKAFVRHAENDTEYHEVDATSVLQGQIVRVRPGELIPVDGVIDSGHTSVNESALTGESRPRDLAPADRVLAGTVNLTGLVHVRATAVGDSRVAAQIHRLLAQARRLQPPIQRLADRVARAFVPGVVVLALAVFAFNVMKGQPLQGLFNSLSVLLISCPCALGLSAPLATWSAISRAARQGILISSGQTLERAASVTHVFFDKTGTLTTDRLKLAKITVFPAENHPGLDPDQSLALAAAIEETSLHPIARTIAEEARARNLAPAAVEKSQTLAGVGVHATVAGREYFLGGDRLLARLGVSSAPSAPTTHIRIFLVHEKSLLAAFDLTEQLRPDAPLAIEKLRAMAIDVSILTGDQPGPAQNLAQQLNLPVSAGLLPDGKLHQLSKTRENRPENHRIAMVGDGLNDAPVLAAADVGFVIGNATDLASHSANIHILSTRLTQIPAAVALCRHAMKRIRFNLAWSFGYNFIGITLAAIGLLSPLFAASAMILSSIVIVVSSKNAGATASGPAPAAPGTRTSV